MCKNVVVLGVILSLLSIHHAQGVNKLSVTVSGQSSGGSMAVNHLFAHSASLNGALIAAGSPYGCGSLLPVTITDYQCDTNFTADKDVHDHVLHNAANHLIDDPAHLRTTPVHLFSGLNDNIVYTNVMRGLQRQLRAEGATNVATAFGTAAVHVWCLDHGECVCGEAGPHDTICDDTNNCNYDLSGDFFRKVYGSIKARVAAQQSFTWFRQDAYLTPASWTDPGVMEWGFAYVPAKCRSMSTSCRVHVHYHSCLDDVWAARELWAHSLDLSEYGESNEIIVLHPQAKSLAGYTQPGCWNWGGAAIKSDPLYDTKHGAQVQMVANMLANLTQLISSGVERAYGSGPPPDTSGMQSDRRVQV